jgi:hypothetical protein
MARARPRWGACWAAAEVHRPWEDLRTAGGKLKGDAAFSEGLPGIILLQDVVVITLVK